MDTGSGISRKLPSLLRVRDGVGSFEGYCWGGGGGWWPTGIARGVNDIVSSVSNSNIYFRF